MVPSLASLSEVLEDSSIVLSAPSVGHVHLVEEQDDVVAGPDLDEYLLRTLFDVAALARPGHKLAEAQPCSAACPSASLGVVGTSP
ncbi:MAG TPA: hypothetical protein VFQ44_09500 [Streptosporangiaceae bacterium]|nr:hypothetical protein [Streptosporangiaceae bacterium]